MREVVHVLSCVILPEMIKLMIFKMNIVIIYDNILEKMENHRWSMIL